MDSRIARWAAGALLVAALAACGEKSPGAGSAADGLPELGAGTHRIPFGDVRLGAKVERRFALRNHGDDDLVVQPVTADLRPFGTSLQCADGERCAPRQVRPGASLVVSVSFQPVAESMEEREIRIVTSAYTATLQVSGRGDVPRLRCETPEGEGYSLDFGGMVKGSTATRTIRCTNESSLDVVLQVLGITGPNARSFSYSTPADGMILLQGGRSVEIPVTFRALPTALHQNFAVLNMQVEGGPHLAPFLLTGTVVEGCVEIHPLPELADDGSYDFGFVRPGTSKEIELTLQNGCNVPLETQDLSLDPTSDRSFTLEPQGPFTIPPYGEVSAVLRFAPELVGLREGQLNVVLSDPANPVRAYRVRGFGGGPEVACAAELVAFGPTAIGVPRVREVVCTNVAAFDDPETEADRLRILEPLVRSPGSGFTVRMKEEIEQDGYGVWESFTLLVAYDPAVPGPASATVVVKTNEGGRPELEIPVEGEGLAAPPCLPEIRPVTGLRFGNVPPGRSVTLDVAVTNLGDTACVLQDVRMGAGSDPAFRLGGPGAADLLPFVEIAPRGEARIPVRYAPGEAEESATGELRLQINVLDSPEKAVALSASSRMSCLLLAPAEIDLGVVAPDEGGVWCSTRTHTVEVFNTCPTPVDVTGIVIPGGQASGEFAIARSPLGPVPAVRLPGAGDQTSFDVVYRPRDAGEDVAAVWIQTAQQGEPEVVVLHGRGELPARQVDRFVQPSRPKVDVLWVVSNMKSMTTELEALQEHARHFWEYAVGNGLDFHLGVTTTGTDAPSGSCLRDGSGGLEDGRLVPVDGTRARVVTPRTPDGLAVWKENLRREACQDREGGVHTSVQAVTEPMSSLSDDPRYAEEDDGNKGFLRPDAMLSIVYFTDGTDEWPQPPRSTGFHHVSLLAAKGFDPGKLSIHGFVNGGGCPDAAGDGTRYAEMIRGAGGRLESICAADWPQAMRDVAAAAAGVRRCFPLTGLPDDTDGDGVLSDETDPPELEVRLDGERFARTGPGGNRQWSHDAAAGALCFSPLSLPEPGTKIDVTYAVACAP